MPLRKHQQVWLDYTNWRGVRTGYRVNPIRLEWGSNEWRPEKQWLLVAIVVGSSLEKTFALKSIHSWEPDA